MAREFDEINFNKSGNGSLNFDAPVQLDVRVLAMSNTMHKIGEFFFSYYISNSLFFQ